MFQSSIGAISDVFKSVDQAIMGAEFQRFFQWLNQNAGHSGIWRSIYQRNEGRN